MEQNDARISHLVRKLTYTIGPFAQLTAIISHTYPCMLHTYGKRRIKKKQKDTKKKPIGHIQSCSEMHLAVGPVNCSEKQVGLLVQWVWLDKKRGVLCWQKSNAVLAYLVYVACSLSVLLTQVLC